MNSLLSQVGKIGADKKVLCVCKCGRTTRVNIYKLRSGHTRSCGCLAKNNLKSSKTHGLAGSPTYKSWSHMRQRCTNPKCCSYKYYGAVGVAFCRRWDKFENFLKDMGEKPSGKHTLDRIDSNKDYTPENCRWATHKTQSRNRRNIKIMEFDGIILHGFQEASNYTGLCPDTIAARLRAGWSVKKTLETPSRCKQRYKKTAQETESI